MLTNLDINSQRFARWHPYADREIDIREDIYARRTLACDEIVRHRRCRDARSNAINSGKKVWRNG